MASNIIFATVISSIQIEDKKLNKALQNYAYKLKEETKGIKSFRMKVDFRVMMLYSRKSL